MKNLFGQEFDLNSASSIVAASAGVAKSTCNPLVDVK
jgi:hypothetical protein